MGIDPHKKTHTAVAVRAATGEVCAELTVPARQVGFERLVAWARELDHERSFAIEDGRHVSGHLERYLIGRGERAVRVPPRMMGESRRHERAAGKSDPVDAAAVARAALRHPDLPEAVLAGAERELGLPVAHREMLVNERTDRICKLRWLLHDIDSDLAPPLRTLDRLATLDGLREVLCDLEPSITTEVCLELLDRCRQITVRAKELERRITVAVADQAPQLLAICGCGALSAAKILAETAGVSRFPTEGHFARYAGTAPIPASSGNRNRQRYNRRGNRQLNAAIHRIVVTQIRIHEPARDYVAKKRAEGKTKTEAIRALKRQITRTVFKTLMSTDQHASTA